MNRTPLFVLGVFVPGVALAQVTSLPPFAALDTDGNGALCRLEVANVPLLRDEFDRFDRNHNGLIQPHEYVVPLPEEESASGGATAPRAVSELFQRLDRNADGYLSPQELRAPAAVGANWVALDRDGDGRISPSEFRSLASR